MSSREKQIEALQNILIENGIFNNLICRQDYAYPDALINDLCLETAQVIYNNNYRKMDEITLKLDLGDRAAEEIQQIAEAFANESTTAILVPSNESEIKKQVAKEIIDSLLSECDSSPYDCVEPNYILYLAKKYDVEIEK